VRRVVPGRSRVSTSVAKRPPRTRPCGAGEWRQVALRRARRLSPLWAMAWRLSVPGPQAIRHLRTARRWARRSTAWIAAPAQVARPPRAQWRGWTRPRPRRPRRFAPVRPRTAGPAPHRRAQSHLWGECPAKWRTAAPAGARTAPSQRPAPERPATQAKHPHPPQAQRQQATLLYPWAAEQPPFRRLPPSPSPQRQRAAPRHLPGSSRQGPPR
jgi:hypothetical protein